MENLIVPKPKNINPSPNDQGALAKAEKEEFEAIGTKVINLLSEEGLTVKDLPLLMKYTAGLLNQKFDNAPMNKVLEL